MVRRGLMVVAVALLVGTTGGYLAAREFRSAPTPVSVQNPVPAEEPDVPGADSGLMAEPDLEPLAPVTLLSEATLTTNSRQVVVPVPIGWGRHDLRPGEARWTLPEEPSGTHSVRVRIPPEGWTLGTMVEDRREALRGDPTITDLQLIDANDSVAMVTATFVRNGYRKLMIIRWINFSGARRADLEIAWTGRYRDEQGMRSLLTQMAAGARPAADEEPTDSATDS